MRDGRARYGPFVEKRYEFLGGRLRMELRGRLGNQLFNWATGYAISTDLGLKFCMSSRTVRGNLDLLDLDLGTPLCNEAGFADLYRRSVKLKWLRMLTGIGAVVEEESHEYDPRVLGARGTQTLRGYFQSWRYFEHHRDVVVEKVSTLRAPSSPFREKLRALEQDQWVAIHVRGGEYREKSDTFVQLGSAYYAQALETVFGVLRNPKIVLFSDDIEYAKVVVPHFDETLSSEEIPSPAERLVLSMRANALIGANSTFSWWAAYGQKKTNSLQIFPSNWFVANWLSEADLLHPDWIVIPVQD